MRAAFLVFYIPFIVSTSAAQTRPSSSDFKTLATKAEAARNSDQVEKAISLYKQALALRPSWAEGWFYLGTLHYDRAEYSPAETAFAKASSLQPKSGTSLAMLGLTEFQLGKDDEALKHLQAGKAIGVAADPSLRQVVLFEEALLLQRKGSFDAAQDSLARLCRDHVERADLIQALGQVQLRLRDDRALPFSRSSREGGAVPPPSEQDVILRIGQAGCLAAQKRYDEARPAFAQVVQDFPDFPNIHYAFGNFLADLPDIAAAKQQYELEIKNNPSDVLSRLKIAALVYRTDSAAGIPFARDAIKIDPKLPLAHYLLGLLLLDTDDYKAAIPELELAKKGLPAEPKLYFALGTAYARAGRNAEAAQARAQFQRLQKKQASTNSADAPN